MEQAKSYFPCKPWTTNNPISTSCSVATRATEDAGQKVDGHGVVFTNPVPEGGMLRVAVLEHNELFKGGLVRFHTEQLFCVHIVQS